MTVSQERASSVVNARFESVSEASDNPIRYLQ